MPNIEWIEEDEVLELHQAAISQYGGSKGLRDKNLLMSGLGKPRHHCFYKNIYDLYELAALYTIGIANNHPFVDANKRTGYLTAIFFLAKNGIIKTFKDDNETVRQTVSLAKQEISYLDYADYLLNG